jgi:GT2 family glycosyltransferase
MTEPGPQPSPQAAIVIPHFNDTARLRKCLAALTPQVAGRPVETIVVDNGSTEDLGPLRSEFPWVRILCERARGAAPARNTGVAGSRAPWLFFIDADCVPAPDWLDTALGLGGWDGIIGGRVDLFDETPPPRSGAEAFETVFAFPQRSYVERKRFSVTANLLTTRAVFDATGPFEASLAEDMDWCHRAGRLGYAVRYHPELAVAHPTRGDWTALARKWRRVTIEGFHANGTDMSARARWALRAMLMPASIPLHLPRALGSPRLATGGERLRCAATLVRLRLLRMAWMLRQAATGSP